MRNRQRIIHFNFKTLILQGAIPMKKKILAASILLISAMTFSAYAADEHHPAADAQPTVQKAAQSPAPAAKKEMGKMDMSMMDMQETGKKMMEATNPEEKEALMQKHMQQMKDGMKMMDSMKDAKGGAMEKKMKMMMTMMSEMMMQQETMMKK
jgi:hypothetical protein